MLAVLVCSVSGLSSNKGVPGRLPSEISSAPATRASDIPEPTWELGTIGSSWPQSLFGRGDISSDAVSSNGWFP